MTAFWPTATLGTSVSVSEMIASMLFTSVMTSGALLELLDPVPELLFPEPVLPKVSPFCTFRVVTTPSIGAVTVRSAAVSSACWRARAAGLLLRLGGGHRELGARDLLLRHLYLKRRDGGRGGGGLRDGGAAAVVVVRGKSWSSEGRWWWRGRRGRRDGSGRRREGGLVVDVVDEEVSVVDVVGHVVVVGRACDPRSAAESST